MARSFFFIVRLATPHPVQGDRNSFLTTTLYFYRASSRKKWPSLKCASKFEFCPRSYLVLLGFYVGFFGLTWTT